MPPPVVEPPAVPLPGLEGDPVADLEPLPPTPVPRLAVEPLPVPELAPVPVPVPLPVPVPVPVPAPRLVEEPLPAPLPAPVPVPLFDVGSPLEVSLAVSAFARVVVWLFEKREIAAIPSPSLLERDKVKNFIKI